MTRIVVGKTAGLIIGLICMFTLPMFDPEATWMLRWAFLLWYTTLGAVIGVFGVFSWHPILKLPMPWWFRAPWVGAWMNFVLALFIYDNLQEIMSGYFGPDGALASPFWFVAEGAIAGLIIGYLATRFGGEGSATVAAP